MLTSTQIARVCHEANRELQRTLPSDGIPVSAAWDDESAEQRASVIAGVEGVILGNTPEQSHEAWMAHKRAQGWVYGPVKSEAALTHPCLVPYDELAPEDRVKDALFAAIVGALYA